MGMWIIHCDETASWLPLSSKCGGVVLAWLISENTSPRRGLAEGLFFLCCFCVFLFKCDGGGMQVLILMDCMIVVFRLSDRNAPLHAETLEIWQKERRSPIYPPMNLSNSVRKICGKRSDFIYSLLWNLPPPTVEPTTIDRAGPYSRPARGGTRGFTGRGHFRSELIGARQLQEIASLLVGFL